MGRGKAAGKAKSSNRANLGFEQTLWQAADKLRGNMDAADVCKTTQEILADHPG